MIVTHMTVRKIALYILPWLMMLAACNRKPVIELEQENSALVKENMINANRVVIQSEGTQIESYVSRRGWTMQALPSGALYWEYAQGDGAQVAAQDNVEVTYRLEALDGTPIYTHQIDTLEVGKRQVTPALDDMLQQVRYGSKVWLIAPSNSAYGVVGDGDRVQPRTVIIYNVTNIKKI